MFGPGNSAVAPGFWRKPQKPRQETRRLRLWRKKRVGKFDNLQIAAAAHFPQAHDSIYFSQGGIFYAAGSPSLIGGLWCVLPDRSTWLCVCRAGTKQGP
jgi:hypothetical protein